MSNRYDFGGKTGRINCLFIHDAQMLTFMNIYQILFLSFDIITILLFDIIINIRKRFRCKDSVMKFEYFWRLSRERCFILDANSLDTGLLTQLSEFVNSGEKEKDNVKYTIKLCI